MLSVWDWLSITVLYSLHITNCHYSIMKQSRHFPPPTTTTPLTDKNHPNSNKSNISSLKAILNQGRVPLAQYINEKAVKNDNNHQNLSYFDKLKAMFAKAEMKTGRQKPSETKTCEMDIEQGEKQVGIDPRMVSYLNNYAENNKINFNAKLQGYQARVKERSMSMNAKSRPKAQNMHRVETAANRSKKNIEMDVLERTYNKAYTQVETLEVGTQKAITPILIPKFKPVKKEVVNYSKFSNIYSSGELQSGVLELDETLGCGAYATVRVGKEKKTSKLFAVKIYEKYKLVEPSKKKRVFREIEILSKIQHQNIIRIGDCYQDKRQIHILFQFIPNASTLQDFLRNNSHSVPLYLRNQIAASLSGAISYLHKNGISHRDIKTDNVMIGEDGVVKLIDFGFATTVAKGETHCGTPNYMAPELFHKKGVYNTFKVDVWALGILLYYLYEGCYPFKGYNEKELTRNITQGAFSFKKTTKTMREIITCALQVDPNQRPQAEQLEELIRAQQKQYEE